MKPEQLTELNKMANLAQRLRRRKKRRLIMKPEQLTELNEMANDSSNSNISIIVTWPSDFRNDEDHPPILKNIKRDRYSKAALVLCIENGVETIPKSLLSGNTCFKEVRIPASVKHIEEAAFATPSIETVVMAEDSQLEIIGKAAFSHSLIKEFTSKTVTQIGEQAFMECEELKSVCVPNVREIKNLAFTGDINLSTIDISSIETIGGRAFAECSLSELVTPPSLKQVGAYAFYKCCLEKVDMSQSSIEIIPRGIFESNFIKSLELPLDWEVIGEQAFKDNSIEHFDRLKLNFDAIIAANAFDMGVIR